MSRLVPGTPLEDGYLMPAEWEPHDGCWLAWPENTYVWREGAKPAQRAFALLANTLAETGERVTVTVCAGQYPFARSQLAGVVRVLEMSTGNAWARDVAPTFVVDAEGRRRGVDWTFNGYGRISPGWMIDRQYTRKVLDVERVDRYVSPLVAEGGAIHVDGQGTCLTTVGSLLDQGRNPDLDRDQVADLLARYLGVRKVVWLPYGLTQDVTGHVDNVACFTSAGPVCLTWTDDERDPQYERSAAAAELLTAETDAAGRPLTVVRLPIPGPLALAEDETGTDAGVEVGTRLNGSYVNFYVANNAVLVPAFGTDTDAEARRLLGPLFPDREIIGVPTREILLGGGNIHCATQQVPGKLGD